MCVEWLLDAESRITEIRFQIGSSEGSDDVLGNISLPGHTTMYIAKGDFTMT